ncbi:MAG TPA: CHAT domain-containing protein [Anaerolineales bacterium]|nr:CHAT domain-containing protein [Anaerolineales bacterium]
MSESIEYLDFEINIDKADETSYWVRAISQGGRAETRFTDPFTPDKRTIFRQTLTNASLRSSARVRSSSAPEIKAMKEFGSTLFENVLHDQVKEFYYHCLGQAHQQAKGLRLRLSIDPSLNELPWEFLYAPQKEFLGLDPHTPIVRFIELPTPTAPLRVDLPLRILVVIASPKDLVPLDVEAEKARIAAALDPLQAQGYVRVSYLEGPDTWTRLIDALRPNQTHILHFIGHGAFDEVNNEGVLLMESVDGGMQAIGSDLIRILLQGKTQLRLAVLNSCLGAHASDSEPFSSVAAAMVRAGIPAVIAMQFEVSDRADEIISGTFYKSLALNFPVDAALTEARRQIALLERDSLEWATPVLFMQVPDGQLFNISKPPDERLTAGPMEGTLAVGGAISRQKEPASPAVAPPEKPDLNARAAERYQAAEEATIRGDWEAAIAGYRGALMLVPNYKDAAQKLANSERRNQCVKLYAQAQKDYADKNYAKVMENLNQIRNIDPRWVDSADLQMLAECGLTYQQALTVLQAGDRQTGAELLRSIILKCSDFEDVLSRLDNLAAGGDGLFGQTSPVSPLPTPSRPPVPASGQPVPAPPAQPTGGRTYEVREANVGELAEEFRQYFLGNGFETQVIHQGATVIIQGKKGGLRSWVGMGQAATVMLESTGTTLKASVGGGKWLEQGAAIAVSIVVLWPLLITGGVGMAQQKGLIDSLWKMVDNYVAMRGGRRVT